MRTHLWSRPQAALQGEVQGFPLVCVPQDLGSAHVHAHALGHALCDVVLDAPALALALLDMVRRRSLCRRRTLEDRSGALGRS